MKALIGTILFLIVLLLCTFLAKPIYKDHIEQDLAKKVSVVLKKHGISSEGLEVKGHHLVSLPEIPSAGHETLYQNLDKIIGLYVNDKQVAPIALDPPHFAITEHSNGAVTLTGLVGSESDRVDLLEIANSSSPHQAIDQLIISDKVAAIEPFEQLKHLTPRVVQTAENASLKWSPTELVLGGLLQNQEEEGALLSSSQGILPEALQPTSQFQIQPFQETDFGLVRDDNIITLTGVLPDTSTHEQLLKLIKERAGDATVNDQTTIAQRARKIWWNDSAQKFIPAILSHTQGPASFHYYPDRFTASARFTERLRLSSAKSQIRKISLKVQTETDVSLFTIPEQTIPAPTEHKPEVVLIKNLQKLAVYFDTSSDLVKTSELEKIEQAAQLILNSSNIDQDLTVGGYADMRGNAEFNRSLSLKRANAVRSLLIEKGVPANRLIVNHFGENNSNTAPDDLWKSRRVEISLSPISNN